MLSHQDHARRLLVELETDACASQRSLSRGLGIALGLTNLVLRDLVRKGWVRVIQVKSNRTRYLLTPAGTAEKTRLSRQALQNNVRFYAEARDRIAERFAQLSSRWPPAHGLESGSAKRVVFYGGGEVAEIGYIGLSRTDLQLVGLVDDRAKEFFGVPVFSRDELRPGAVAGIPFQMLVVMTLGETDEIHAALEARMIPPEQIAWL